MEGAARDGKRTGMEEAVMVMEFMVVFSEGIGRSAICKFLILLTSTI